MLDDRFVRILVEELLAKHQKVCNGQVHRRHRVDSAGSASVAPERATSVSLPAKRGSRVRNPEAAVTRVSAPMMPSLAAPSQNTRSRTTRRKGARVVQTRIIPPWIKLLSPVPREDQEDVIKMEDASPSPVFSRPPDFPKAGVVDPESSQPGTATRANWFSGQDTSAGP